MTTTWSGFCLPSFPLRQSRQVRPVFTGADVPGDSALCVPSRCTLTAGQEIFLAWIFGT
ncbi:hypothetical protein [Streptomyces sp. NPDC086182]|jgi:hypothetical protein|uniref:hypothetical protein n=1 Tax=Streptomyces sp. NPDC086182 TaxID=3155058 RepID=UPI0034420517